MQDISMVRAVASPRGDIVFDAKRAACPLDGDATGLTYGAYFDALEYFLAADGYGPVRAALEAAHPGFGPEAVTRLELRAQKHGALYHPASVDVVGPGRSLRLCANVATTPLAKECLRQEAGLLTGLRRRFVPTWLPRVYAAGEAGGCGVLLETWFAGFHEFHQDGAGRVRLWDYDAGERLLRSEEACAVYREAARILTAYYDVSSGAAIMPWHHAAGDFVARVADGQVAVRLITVRGYGTARAFPEAGPMAERLAALAFFTSLTMRMRLDRVDGVGDLVLAGPDVAAAAVAGFTQALGERADIDDGGLGLLDFLGSFSAEELAGAGRQLMDDCPEEEQVMLAAAWPEHAAVLVEALRG